MPILPRRPFHPVFLVLAAAACATGCEASDESAAPQTSAPDASFDGGRAPATDAGARDAEADAGTARDHELARMQAHLDALYSPADVVHRFTTAFGDPVDCVPFARQPGVAGTALAAGGARPAGGAFASSDPRAVGAGASFGAGSDAEGNARECPAGAVPIRRWTLADLARYATLEDFLRKEPRRVLDQVDALGFTHEHAARSVSVANWGAQATLDVWDPAVEPQTFSLSQMWVVGGSGSGTQTVEAGYSADPMRHGDARSRLFIYATRDDYATGCYDLTCKGFVQMAGSRVLLGGRFDRTSQPGGEQRVFTLRWQLCPASECGAWEGWWLRYDGGALSEWVGFYPRAMFAGGSLQDGADRLDFGGEVAFVRGGAHTATDMGSGEAPAAGFGHAAYQSNLFMITTGNAWARLPATSRGVESASCYDVGDVETSGRGTSDGFYFGGAGLAGDCR